MGPAAPLHALATLTSRQPRSLRRGLTIRAGLANAGETIVSRTVKDVVVGSGFVFGDAGEHSLEGVEDT